MAQNTFRQTIMGNAQPKPFWEQPVPTKAPPAMVGPAAPTPEQMQSMEPATSVSDFDLAPEPAPLTMQVPPTTQAQFDAREAARGGNGQEPAESLFRQILDTPGQMSKNADEFFGSAMRYFTPKEELGYTPPTGGDVLATAGIRAPGGDIFGSPGRTEIITKPQDQPTIKTTAAPVPQIAPEPAPEPAIKPQSAVQLDPTSDEAILARRAQRQGTSSPQQNFQLRVSNGEPLSQEEITQAEALAEHMGTTFDPVTGYSRQPFLDAQSTPQQGVQQGSGLTTVGGAPLNEFLSGAAMPERGFARAENAMYGDNSLSRGLSGDAATKAFQDASAAREGRIEQGFGRARGPDSRDGEDASGAPTALFKEQAESAGLTGQAKSNYIQEQTRIWGEEREDRATEKSSAAAKAAREKIELGLKVSAEERALVKADDEKTKKKEVIFEESRNNVRATQDAFSKLTPVAKEIATLSGSAFTEGTLGWAASILPMSTDARQIERLTTEFEGSAFLQGLIEAKGKGATFGALSEQEGNRILGQWGTITDPSSKNDQRIRAINNMLSSIQRSAERAASDHNEKFPDRPANGVGAASSGQQARYSNDQDVGESAESYYSPSK